MTTTHPETERCFNCAKDIEDITEQDVLDFIGDGEVSLHELLNGVGGTLAKRSKLITGLIRRGVIELTVVRSVRRTG